MRVGPSKDHYRLVVMGGANVGKSCLVSRFLYNTFAPDHKATVEDLHSLPGWPLAVDILDTTGSYHFPAMQRLAIQSGQAFILVFSLEDQSSFDEVARLREEVLRIKGACPVVIVANKCDARVHRRMVDSVVAEAIVTCDWEHKYIETSAKEDVNVVSIFKQLLQPCLLQPYALAHSKDRKLFSKRHKKCSKHSFLRAAPLL